MSTPATPDPDPDGTADEAPEQAEPVRPVTFSERHRPTLGVIAVVVSLAVAVFFAVVGPAVEPPEGLRGVIVRWGAPVCWFLLAVVFTTWAMRMKPRITQRLSFVVLGFYLVYMTARFL